MSDILLLCGPTGAGKTRRLVEAYVTHADRYGDDSVALLLPTTLAVAAYSNRIARARSKGGLYDARIFTFPTLAETLLDANHRPVRRISDLQRRLLLTQLIDDLHGQGRLPYLEGVASFPGFLRAVGSILDELKRAAVDPSLFEQLTHERIPDHPVNADLIALYRAYQDHLIKRGLYDEPGAFWEARALLRDGKRRPLDRVSLLLLDGFSELTTTQMQVFEDLAAHVERCVVGLSTEAAQDSDLFAVPRRTLGRLLSLEGARVEWLEPEPDTSALQGIRSALFRFDGRRDLRSDASLRLLGAPGVVPEVRRLAREIKSLLLEGTPPSEIAVVLRDPDTYAVALRDVFSEYGLPCAITHGESLSARPVVQAVLDLLHVVADDYQAADVAKLVGNSYVSSSELLSDQAITPDDFEACVLAAHILGGGGTWARQFKVYQSRLAAERDRALQAEAEEDEENRPRSPSAIEAEVRRAEAAATLFDSLRRVLSPLERSQRLSSAVAALVQAVTTLGILEGVRNAQHDLHEIARDLSALELLFQGLREMAETAGEMGTDPVVKPADLLAHLRDYCSESRLSDGRSFDQAVSVLDAYEVRQLRFREVFLPGLIEGSFPRARRQEPFYHDDARRRLNAGSLVLEECLPQQSEESYLLYTALSCATRRVWLSYPTSDTQGQPLLRSHYVDEVLSRFEPGCAPQPELARLSEIVASPGELACTRELLEAAALDENLAPVAREVAADRWSHVQRAAAVERQRDSLHAPGVFEGVLPSLEAKATVRGLFGVDHKFSASAMACYGNCPLSFYFADVLQLSALEEPTEEAQALDLGLITHRVLRNFFRERQHGTDNFRPLTSDELEAETERLTSLVGAVFREWDTRGLVGHARLWEITRQEVEQDLQEVLLFEARHNEDPKGTPRAVWGTEIEYGEASPFTLGEGEDALLLHGRIDRIDVIPGTEPLQFVLLDYKRGQGESPAAIQHGVSFQLPLYYLAARRTAFEGLEAEGSWWAYYRVAHPVEFKYRAGQEANRNTPPIADLVDAAVWYLVHHVAALRRGEFPVIPATECDHCDFKNICRFKRQSAARKREAWEALHA
ncbi:MAG: PD-(D/E)XK nuclease family protein [Armatimonadia bacterium]